MDIAGTASCQSLNDPLPRAVDLLRQGRFIDAEAALGDVPAASASPSQRYQYLLLQAGIRRGRDGREAGLAALRLALSYGREAGLLDCVLCQAPDILASLCAEALEAGVEIEYVQRLIRRSHLQPPSPAIANWPYPIHVYTLGRPAIVVDGKPIDFSGKAQRRPLELLYYLASNGGREIAVARVLNALWTDEDHAVSRTAFDMALGRLRRLLGAPDALPLAGGRLSLSDRVCWVDVRACERMLGEVDTAPDADCRLALLDRILHLYQGDFLVGEEAGWAVLARERLLARLMRGIRHTGQSLEEAGRWSEATAFYERVRERFPVDEDLCRRLIRSHIELGEFAQATHQYGRCRELFAKVLGVLPSPATLDLLRHPRPKPTP
jgi:LuxR family transcriptional regulator, maltose regulon positive regulatory protein